MEMVLRAAAIYLILLIIFKIAGRRTLMQLTNFDLILLLIISEATQQAMLSTDYSVTGSMLTIVTLVSIDILFGYIKKKFAQAENFLDGTPVIVVENGAVIDEKIKARYPLFLSRNSIGFAIYHAPVVYHLIPEREWRHPLLFHR
ncbi:DUF421 domain-containing protein [Klebsiella pneumoniae]